MEDITYFNLITLILSLICSTFLLGSLAKAYFTSRPCKVFLLDFACYKPVNSLRVSHDIFMEQAVDVFSEESLEFQKNILEKSGLGHSTYFPEAIWQVPFNPCMADARKELQTVIYGSIDEVLIKTGVKAVDVGFLIVNCSLFNPSPSVCSMIINHYKLKSDVVSYNLGGMGCSAGLIAMDLAKQLLQVHMNSYVLVVSTEIITLSLYKGNKRSMLVPNCLFRMGGAAILLSNRLSDHKNSKYQLIRTVRTHKGSEDRDYKSTYQEEDGNGITGLSLSKDLAKVAEDALRTNITLLCPLVLPLSEKFLFLTNFIARRALFMKMVPYVPDFKLLFEHFCIHPGGKGLLDKFEKNLKLSEWKLEPSRMTLYRFGNTSSSSVWYELAYSEAKGRIQRGDRVLQIGLGAGFKCNSAVWSATRTLDPSTEKNAWMEEIESFPVHMDTVL
ncbi:hypothetical protein MKX03_005293 [Papaver bracteatum]|nr:hypothetical protein MKX03_005293 [Papaver bracteatum]